MITNMGWKITFYNTKVESQTLSFPPGILANFLHIAEMIEELGPRLGSHISVHWVLACMKYEQKEEKALVAPYTAQLLEKKLLFSTHL